jgi:hypothetical protein
MPTQPTKPSRLIILLEQHKLDPALCDLYQPNGKQPPQSPRQDMWTSLIPGVAPPDPVVRENATIPVMKQVPPLPHLLPMWRRDLLKAGRVFKRQTRLSVVWQRPGLPDHPPESIADLPALCDKLATSP